MGEPSSGKNRLRDARRTVEDGRVLSADALTRYGTFRPGQRTTGTVTWTARRTGKAVSQVGYGPDTRSEAAAFIGLRYTLTRSGEAVDDTVRLTVTKTPWGATRWCFRCPLARGDAPCRRRASKLYLPPGGRHYGCRRCHDLTYTSSRESHKYDAMFRRLAADAGVTPAAGRPLLERGEW